MATLNIISQAQGALQVVWVTDVELTFPSKQKQVRKMSFTRHLRNENGHWMGYGLEKINTPKGGEYPIVDYTDAVKKALKDASK